MKKLNNELINIIRNGIEIGTALDIEAIVLDSTSMRGENRDSATNIIFNMEDYELPFDGIGIGRTQLFKKRLAMFASPEVLYDTSDRDGQTIVSEVTIKNGRTSAGFRCQVPSRIRAPKRIKDNVIFNLTLNDDDIDRINKGINTMSSEKVIVYVEEGKAVVGISDKEGDVFTHEIEGGYTVASDDAPNSFNQTYKSKTFKTILMNYMKKDDSEILPISITSRGVMKFQVLGIDIYLFGEA